MRIELDGLDPHHVFVIETLDDHPEDGVRLAHEGRAPIFQHKELQHITEQWEAPVIASCVVPLKHQRAVALALLRGITDEMIERGAKALYGGGDLSWAWDDLREPEKDVCRASARRILDAVFGQGESAPGTEGEPT